MMFGDVIGEVDFVIDGNVFECVWQLVENFLVGIINFVMGIDQQQYDIGLFDFLLVMFDINFFNFIIGFV